MEMRLTLDGPANLSSGPRAGIPGRVLLGETMYARSESAESFVDDLNSSRGVVLGRAATTLRSIETHPRTGRIRSVCAQFALDERRTRRRVRLR